MAIYGYPVLPQAGLGNMLIPWASCWIWCKDNDARMLEPAWFKLRIGPILRGDRDNRFYHRVFVSGGAVGGWRRLALLSMSHRVSAEDWFAGRVQSAVRRDTVVCFSGIERFDRLLGRQSEILSALNRMTRPQYRPTEFDFPFIGIHVRTGGDARNAPPAPDVSEPVIYFRQPTEWYAECLERIRLALGINIRAVVFSEGSDEELALLLQMPGVSRSPYRSAVSDLLALAQSSAIITSRSTLSLWAVYLSQAPSAWYPNKISIGGPVVIVPGRDSANFEINWIKGMELPAVWLEEIRQRIQHRMGGR